MHGAAIRPPTRPIANAPPKPLPPTWFERACRPAGRLSSNAPNIDAASATNRSTSGITTTGCAELGAEAGGAGRAARTSTPSTEYVTPMPTTYAVASRSARRLRDVLAARAEDREGDRDHRVDARRERRQEAEAERREVHPAEPALLVLARSRRRLPRTRSPGSSRITQRHERRNGRRDGACGRTIDRSRCRGHSTARAAVVRCHRWSRRLRPAARPRPRRVPARKADRGAGARARDLGSDQGRVEREPARAVAEGARGDPGGAAAAPPLSRRRRVRAAARARGPATACELGAARARQRLERSAVPARARDLRADRRGAVAPVRVPVVPARGAGRGAAVRRGAGDAGARVRRRRADRRDHAAHQARRARDAEQPDGLGGHARRRASAILDGAAGARAARRSTRRTPSTRRAGPRSITPTASRCCGAIRASIVLRTFSKIYGLAGLRVGFAMADAARDRRRSAASAARSTSSSLAQVGAIAALDDTEHVARSARHARAAIEQLRARSAARACGSIRRSRTSC